MVLLCCVTEMANCPTLLGKINVNVFAELLLAYYGIVLSEKEKSWFALDGKELKGSILAGDTRGEAIALVVKHEDKSVGAMAFLMVRSKVKYLLYEAY